MKIKYSRIAILILIFANIFWIVKYQNIKNYSVKVQAPNEKAPASDLLKELVSRQYESDGSRINPDLKIISPNGDTIQLVSLLSTPKLFINYKNISCKVCFDDEIERLKVFSTIIGKENIIFLNDFINIREQLVLTKEHGFNFYDIDDRSLNLPLDDEFYPYFVIINESWEAEDFYIPSVDYFDLGDIYLNKIVFKYFSN